MSLEAFAVSNLRPLLTTSAKFGQRIPKLFPLFDKIMEERGREITENALDKFCAR